MESFGNPNVGPNFKKLRKAAQLTQNEIANFLEISDRTLKKFESNEKAAVENNIEVLLNFFGVTRKLVYDSSMKTPKGFREKLQSRHSKNKSFKVILTKKPTIPFGLQILTEGNKLEEPKTISEIKKLFDELGWNWTINAISNAMGKHKKRLGIESKKIEGDNRGLQYWVGK